MHRTSNPSTPPGAAWRKPWLWLLVCSAAGLVHAATFGGCTLPVQGQMTVQCSNDEGCDDGNPCTEGTCSPDGICFQTAVPDGRLAPEQQEQGDCIRAECTGGLYDPVYDPTDTHDDFNDCTDDVCSDQGGPHPESIARPFETPCEEGGGVGICGCVSPDGDVIPCPSNQVPECQITCTPETAPEVCDDGNPCTVDSCDVATSLCVGEELDGVPAPDEEQVVGDCRIIICAEGEPTAQPGEVDNNDLPDDDNDCTEDSCLSGEVQHDPLDEDTPCGPNGAEFCDDSGTCVECNRNDQCGNTATNCLCRQCQDHACVNLPAGTEAPNCQVDNDCRVIECNGAGSAADVADNTDLPVPDTNECTDDVCVNGAPSHPNNSAPCNDGVFCNGTDTCGGGTCSVHSGNPCAGHNTGPACNDSCNEAADNCTANDAANTTCNDGLYCTVTDACNNNGVCVGVGNPCSGHNVGPACNDSCNESADNCTAPDSSGTSCQDGLYCNGADTCNASGQCAVHVGDPCAAYLGDNDSDCSESCNETADSCTANDPPNSSCNDGNYCNGTDTCDASGACSNHGTDPCSARDPDINDCTQTCRTTGNGTGDCQGADPVGSACNDGNYCNSADTCDASGSCSVHGANPCPARDPDINDCTQTCRTTGWGVGDCQANDTNGALCNDGNYCNGTDSCSAGVCTTHTAAPTCPGPDNDADCSETCRTTGWGVGDCQGNDANGAACSDGNYCNGTETCSTGSCGSSSGDPCPTRDPDIDDCTQTCRTTGWGVGDCQGVDVNGWACNDGDYCNGTDTCSGGTCSSHMAAPTCPGPDNDDNCSESCRTTSWGVGDCQGYDGNTSACNDGSYCNGTDTCNAGSCSVHVNAPTCTGPDNDNDCSESCQELGAGTGNCLGPDPNASPCNDGNYCNGTETCSAGSCAGSTGDPCPIRDPDIDDCTQSCQTTGWGVGNCNANDGNGWACNDGDYCNGTDSCSNGACTTHTSPPSCAGADDDADCRETCRTTGWGTGDCLGDDGDGTPCNDGDYCNGTESCSGGSCTDHANVPICPGPDGDMDCAESCQSTGWGVGDCLGDDGNNTPCGDGDFCNGTEVCSGGTCGGSTGNPCPARDADLDDCTQSCQTTSWNLGDCEGYDGDAAACNDGDYCNGVDSCGGGTCSQHTGAPSCTGPDDDFDCMESCRTTGWGTGDCLGADPEGIGCNDGDYCTGAETCVLGVCTSENVDPCGARNPSINDCTQTCQTSGWGTGDCEGWDPDDVACSDGSFCTGTETCTSGVCGNATGDPCPARDPSLFDCTQSCQDTGWDLGNCEGDDPDSSACSDGSYCTGVEVCSGGACGGATGDPCPARDPSLFDCYQSCQDTGFDVGDCAGVDPDTSACSDGTYCNGSETCTSGVCGGSTGDPCDPPASDCSNNCSNWCTEDSGGSCTGFDPPGTACGNPSQCSAGTHECKGDGTCDLI